MSVSPEWQPPDWVTDAFLRESGAAYKLKCRQEGREPWPEHFALVDLIIWWWETQAKSRVEPAEETVPC